MFLRRIALVFIVTHFQSLNKFVTSVTGHNHLINQTTFCRTIRIGEFIFVFLDDLSFLPEQTCGKGYSLPLLHP